MNEALNLITAGAGGVTPCYNLPVPEPVRSAAGGAAARMRLLLLGDSPSSDYRLHGLMSALWCEPGLLELCGETSRTWSPFAFVRPADSLEGGVLVPAGGTPPWLRHVPDAWPPAESWTLSRTSGTSATLEDSEGRAEAVSATLGAGDALAVAWPSRTGFSGNIRLADPAGWESGMPVVVRHQPVGWPFAMLVSLVGFDDTCRTAMAAAGVLGLFAASTTSPARGTACVAAALALAQARENSGDPQ